MLFLLASCTTVFKPPGWENTISKGASNEFDKEDVLGKLKTRQFIYFASKFSTQKNPYYGAVLIIENTSDQNLRIDINYVLKNDGEIVKARDDSCYYVEAGTSVVWESICPFVLTSAEYTLDPSLSEDSDIAVSKISVESSLSGQNVATTFTNNSDLTIDRLTYYALFFKEGELVSTEYIDVASRKNPAFAPGEKRTIEVVCIEDYDEVEVIASWYQPSVNK